jgi:DNA-binding NtrC family response regulator
MSVLDDTYDLSDEDRGVIASELKDMDDETFEGYANKLAVLLSSKSKEHIAILEADKAEKEQEAKASEETNEEASKEVLEEAISQAKEEKEEIPASAEASEQTVYDKYKQAFNIDQFDVKL